MPGYFSRSPPPRRPPRQVWRCSPSKEDNFDREDETIENISPAVEEKDPVEAERSDCDGTPRRMPCLARRLLREVGADPTRVGGEREDDGSSTGGDTESTACNSSSSCEEKNAAACTIATKKMKCLPRAYPMLAPPPNDTRRFFDDRLDDRPDVIDFVASPPARRAAEDNIDFVAAEYEPLSLLAEIAKSAFLEHPCQEHWMDLVNSFRIQNMQRRRRNYDDRATEGGGEDGHDEFQSLWANFGRATDENDAKSVWTRPCDAPATEPASEEDVEIDSALARLESSIASLEEKASRMLRIDDGRSDDDYDSSEESWDGRGASPSSPPAEEGPTSRRAERAVDGGDAASGDAPAETALARATATREFTPPREPTAARTPAVPTSERAKEARSSRVLDEVQHWEERIVRFDQRYVNVVAAALDKAAKGAAWKAGQIVEVVPPPPGGGSSDGSEDGGDEEILYVV